MTNGNEDFKQALHELEIKLSEKMSEILVAISGLTGSLNSQNDTIEEMKEESKIRDKRINDLEKTVSQHKVVFVLAMVIVKAAILYALFGQ